MKGAVYPATAVKIASLKGACRIKIIFLLVVCRCSTICEPILASDQSLFFAQIASTGTIYSTVLYLLVLPQYLPVSRHLDTSVGYGI
jgi:hypothetical protein